MRKPNPHRWVLTRTLRGFLPLTCITSLPPARRCGARAPESRSARRLGRTSRRPLATSTALWRVQGEQGLGYTRIMHRRPTSTSVVAVAALLGLLLTTATAAEGAHVHLHDPSHAEAGGAMAPDAFYGLMDTDEALRRAFDATSDDGRVVLVATAGGDHVVTALNLILQVNPPPSLVSSPNTENAPTVSRRGGLRTSYSPAG